MSPTRFDTPIVVPAEAKDVVASVERRWGCRIARRLRGNDGILAAAVTHFGNHQ